MYETIIKLNFSTIIRGLFSPCINLYTLNTNKVFKKLKLLNYDKIKDENEIFQGTVYFQSD